MIGNISLIVLKRDGKMKTLVTDTPIGTIASFENDMFGRQVRQYGRYAEQDILDKNLRSIIEKSNVILDIGGHVGYHSIAYAKYNPSAQIRVFEPQKQIFELLKYNIEINNLFNNILPYNLAMGDKVRITTLLNFITDGPNAGKDIEYGSDDEFNLGGVSIGFNGERVDMITIDSLKLDKLDYIKIDVEGAETLVIMGGEETIRKFKPIICFEHNHKTISPEFIKSLGYDSLPTPFEILQSFGYTKFTSIQYENFIAE